MRASKKSVDLTFRRYITEGIADGSIKPCDAKLSAFAIAGSLNWISPRARCRRTRLRMNFPFG